MKKLLCSVCAAAVISVFAAVAGATTYNGIDIDYSGVLGSYYEEQNGFSDDQSSARIAVAQNVSYDMKERLFYYSVADIARPFTCSVMDGMITTEAVALTTPDGVACELYRDGDICEDAFSSLKDPGSYILRVRSNSGVSVPVLSFTIVGKTSGAVTGYPMPEGFALNSVVFNGKQTSFRDGYADFSEDGDYSVSYRCGATGVGYTLTLTVDHSRPALKLEGVKNGKIWGPVDISDVEQGGSVTVYRNGQPEPYTPTLTKSGQYELVVTDAAGNKTRYSFTIMIYFNSGSIVFFIAIIALIAGVGVYVMIAGKKLRVR